MYYYIKVDVNTFYGGLLQMENNYNVTNITESINIINERLARSVNIAILGIHIGLFLAFILVDAPIMIIMNIISIATYIIMFKVINKNLVLYLMIVYAEVLVHMALASICLGWKCGFQLYFFAFIPIIYYSDYISKKRNLMKVYPFPMSGIVIAVFFFIRMLAYKDYSIYTHISDATSVVIYTINIIMTFVFLMMFMSMFERMSLNNERTLLHLAEYDLLTNLSNRHRMTAIFDNLLKNDTGFSVAILDIDNFKKVNDTYGHNIGDTTLKAFADVLKAVENDNIYACRWGGEEFLVVLKGDNTYETAKALLELIRVNVSNIRIPTDEGELKITVSSGITKYRRGERPSNTINRADSYLYIAKNSGKNQVIANDTDFIEV